MIIQYIKLLKIIKVVTQVSLKNHSIFMGFSLFSQMPSYFLLALIQIVSHSCHAQQDYLDAHNKSRANVGVRPLTWDDRCVMMATKAVEMWVDEKQYCNHESNTCDEGKVCARVQCNNGGYVVSCNYDPPGNFIGKTPY
uniref:SCP domain-containing protein n=1 Tax=Solanum lycopersicum TaxID=4081 RepID=A0A3Q7IFJ6_SOLLC